MRGRLLAAQDPLLPCAFDVCFQRRRGEPVGWATRRVVHAFKGGGKAFPPDCLRASC
jgi:hypothetical protein